MKGMNRLLILILLIIFSSTNVRKVESETLDEVDGMLIPHLMTPNPDPYQVKYPDGILSPFVQIKKKGQLTSSEPPIIYEETVEGFTVLADKGRYFYVDIDDATGRYKDTGLIAGLDDPYCYHIPLHASDKRQQTLRDIQESQNEYVRKRKLKNKNGIEYHRRTKITNGVMKNLVVPFRFSDHNDRNLPSQSDLYTLMNNNGPHTLCPSESVRDVYLKSSFNQLDIQSVVLDWITIDYTEFYCAGGYYGVQRTFHTCIVNALEKAVDEAGIDLSGFDRDEDGYIDGITFFHSGYAAEFGGFDAYRTNAINRIWSHQWVLFSQSFRSNGVKVYEYNVNSAMWGLSESKISRIGVISHELGHYLGLPDLYDYGDETYGSGEGIGSYGLMGNSWGFDRSQYYPPIMSAWGKYKLGWVSPTLVNTTGSYSLRQACDYQDIIITSEGYPDGEYLIIENRQPCGFDQKLPQGGLAIYHIDEHANNIRGYPGQNGWSNNGNHYKVAILQADGIYELELKRN